MQSQMIIRLDPELKDRAARLARGEGKSVSEVVRELLDGYVRERDIEGYVNSLWDRTGKKLRERGITPRDVNRAIREARGTK